MLSAIEVSISGDLFFLLNDMPPQKLDQIRAMAQSFRTQRRALKEQNTYAAFRTFCSEVEQQLKIDLLSIPIADVIILK